MDRIVTLQLHADGRQLLSASSDGTACIWNLDDLEGGAAHRARWSSALAAAWFGHGVSSSHTRRTAELGCGNRVQMSAGRSAASHHRDPPSARTTTER